MYDSIFEIPDTLLAELIQLYATEWWTKDRTPSEIQKMLRFTDAIVGVIDRKSNKLVGFARAISDLTYKAFILDVIVVPGHRGQGVARLLMDQMMRHPKLAPVNDFELYCKPEHVELYKRWGFQESPGGVLFMRSTRVG